MSPRSQTPVSDISSNKVSNLGTLTDRLHPLRIYSQSCLRDQLSLRQGTVDACPDQLSLRKIFITFHLMVKYQVLGAHPPSHPPPPGLLGAQHLLQLTHPSDVLHLNCLLTA